MNPASHKTSGGQRSNSSFELWPVVVAAFVVVLILCGGISIPGRWLVMFQSALSLLVIVLALFRLARQGFPTGLSFSGALLAAAAVGLVLAQLVPLPPGIWQSFPGRDLVVRNYALIGETPGWIPLSLSPETTVADGLALLPGLAAFLAVLTIRLHHIIWVCTAVVVCAILSVGLSLLQHFHGAGSTYYLYDNANGNGVGTFNNRNFFAAQLYTSIPVLSALAVAAQSRWHLRPILVVAVSVIYSAIILVGLSLSGSRTGILLAMPAILFAVVLAYSRSSGAQRASAGTFGLLALVVGFLVVGQASMLGLLRLVQSDPLTDYRTVISRNSVELASRYFPAGGGFGSFVPLYQLGEKPETMRAEYVNHAHNDWLELVIEGGLPASILLLAFVGWLGIAVFRVWRYGQGGQTALFQRMASFVLPLLLLHSLVDFPLRTPALLVVFAACCGLMCLPPDVGRTRPPGGLRNRPQPRPVMPGERQTFRRPQKGFGAANPVVSDSSSVQ